MPRFSIGRFLALLGVLAPAALMGADRLPVLTAGPTAARSERLADLRRCLSILDLDDQQKAAIAALLVAAKPGIDADVQSVQAARETLQGDLGVSSVDPCAVGRDFLALRAAVEKLKADVGATRDEILAQLRPDQRLKLEGCLQAPSSAATASPEEENARP